MNRASFIFGLMMLSSVLALLAWDMYVREYIQRSAPLDSSVFRSLDRNSDRQLSFEELLSPQSAGEARLWLMTEVYASYDGSLQERPEITELNAKFESGTIGSDLAIRIGHRFPRPDRDQDGFVSSIEWSQPPRR